MRQTMLLLRPVFKAPSWFHALPVEYIVGFTMAAMGISIVAFPTKVISPLADIAPFLPTLYGAALVFCALLVMTKPTTISFLILTFPFLFYVIMSGMYLFMNPGISGVFVVIYAGYYLLMLKVYQWKMEGVYGRTN